MGDALRHHYYLTPEEYLCGERVSQEKHEYLAGVIYAMAATTIGHDRIAGNINAELNTQLRTRKCESFSSEIKVRIQRDAASFYYSPDVVVDCSRCPSGSLALFAGPTVSDLPISALVREDLGDIVHKSGRLSDALDFFGTAEAFYRQMHNDAPQNGGSSLDLARCLTSKAAVCLALDDCATSRRCLEEARALCTNPGETENVK